MAKNNNHARTERKKKVLKLKAFAKRVIEVRQKKLKKSLEPKGTTITGNAERIANYMPYNGFRSYVRHLHSMPRQQNKRRKIARQTQRKVK